STATAVLTLLAGRQAQKGSPPHTRGALVHLLQLHGHLRITPAYAGSTPTDDSRRRQRTDHPRIRGEHTDRRFPPESPHGSPPHTRGAHRPTIPAGDNARITPAYAGSTPPGPWRCQRGSDHPRVRGEHACVVVTATSA